MKINKEEFITFCLYFSDNARVKYTGTDGEQPSRTKGLINKGKATIDGGNFSTYNSAIDNQGECTILKTELNGSQNAIYNGNILTIHDGTFTSDGQSVLSNSGKAVIKGGSYTNTEDSFAILNWQGNGNASLTVTGGTYKSKYCGIYNTENVEMTGGIITGCQDGVQNQIWQGSKPNFEMYGGEIKENRNNGVVNNTGATFKMYGGKISGNEVNGVNNKGDFAYNSNAIIENNGTPGTDNNNIVTESGANTNSNLAPKEPPVVPTPDSSKGESVSEEEVIITDSEGNIVKEPERWVPTTPDEIKRYAFLGKEAVSYNCPKTNPYELKILNAMQGPKCFVSFEAALGDYAMGRTYNIYPDGKSAYSKEQKATITLSIPKDLQKERRTFKMICVTEGGLPIVLNDLDKNPETITFETDKFYAFALIYK